MYSEGWYLTVDWSIIIIGLIVLLVIAYVLVFPFIVANIAEKQGRNNIRWFFLSLLVGPLFALLALIALGDTEEKRIKRIIDDEMTRKSIRDISLNDNKGTDNKHLQQLLYQSRHTFH